MSFIDRKKVIFRDNFSKFQFSDSSIISTLLLVLVKSKFEKKTEIIFLLLDSPDASPGPASPRGSEVIVSAGLEILAFDLLLSGVPAFPPLGISGSAL